MEQASIDTRVLAFTLITAVLTSVLFGILPALFASRINLIEFLKSGGTAEVLELVTVCEASWSLESLVWL